MRVEVESTTTLAFADGSPVRAASAIAPFGDGWLVAQDDATHAAWWRAGSVTAVRVIEPVEGLDVFGSAAGTKHLKPDFEAACAVTVGGRPGVLLLGSGSTAARMRASLVSLDTTCSVAELGPLYRRVAEVLGVRGDRLNLEGACLVGDRLRWFHRANAAAGTPSASVDVDASALLAAVTGHGAAADAGVSDSSAAADVGVSDSGTAADVGVSDSGAAADAGVSDSGTGADVGVSDPRRYELGAVGGVALAVTDALALPDGRILVSAAAEDTPNAVDDGPVVAAALALLDDRAVLATAELPGLPGGACKVEGIALRETTPDGVRLWAVADADDPAAASLCLALRVHW